MFVDRWWDDREHYYPPGVGVVPFSQKPYWGPIPAPTVGPLVGTHAQWLNGFSYDDYINGRLPVGPRCVTVPDVSIVGKIRQKQFIGPLTVPIRFVEQAQDVQGDGALDIYLVAQAQTLPSTVPTEGEVAQAQRVVGVGVIPGTTCETAGLLELGETAERTAGPTGFEWFRIPYSVLGFYHLQFDGIPGEVRLDWIAGTCAGQVQIWALVTPTPCLDADVTTDWGDFFLQVEVLVAGTVYSVSISEGPCP